MIESNAASNNGMHPTANTAALIYLNRSGRRVMPGVRRFAFYPDFIILRRAGKRTIVDLLEPHDITRTDAVYKAKGFARYADKHGEFYGRIELIEVVKGKTKRLNIADETVREKVKRISTSEDLSSLFENL